MTGRDSAGADKKHDGGDPPQRHREPGTVEWIVGTISGLLIVAGIGFLAYEAWNGTAEPPLVSVEATKIVAYENGYVVEFRARNSGGTTARGLSVEGRLLRGKGGEEVAKSSATLTWVPAHAERQGGLFFSKDPRKYHLEVAPSGYERP